jgi:hypothetical protein
MSTNPDLAPPVRSPKAKAEGTDDRQRKRFVRSLHPVR